MSVSPIVDSHVHLWKPAQFRYAWLDGLPALNRAFQPPDFIAASASVNVSKFIFVECGCEPAQSLAEVDWISTLAKSEPRLKGIIAQASLELGESARSDLVTLASRPLVKGVRRNLQAESDEEFCLQPEFIAGVKLLPEFGFTFDLCIRNEQLPVATELARRVPEVVFVLDHLGKPDVRHHHFETWARDLDALAALPNVMVKISGLTTEANWHDWQPADLAPYLGRAFESFGPERLIFGSDWPVMTLATSYQRWVETVQTLVPFSKEPEQVQLFRTNAERIYRV
ncbi:MAG TPA: amidohydrolase family protein [Candidatus Binatia bacterium]|jgi:L-fuconolactonase|nr:amidohydrolase family protein [Candidatus Binatia bacterium]